MMLRKWILISVVLLTSVLTAYSQAEEIHLGSLKLDRKDKKVFSSRDSILTLYIDTLIMGDRASLQFYGKAKINLFVKHAEIGKRAYFWGVYEKNNASDFDISIKFTQLGSLYIMANGQNATNTIKTDPNGDGGHVKLAYDPAGITPQEHNRRSRNYLHIDVSPGGLSTNPSSDIRVIQSMISRSHNGLRGMPGGRIYSGSPGRPGKAEIVSMDTIH